MSRTYKHQYTYDYFNSNKKLPKSIKKKLEKYFDRVNFWDYDLKISYRRHKDFTHGGISRIKKKNYK